MNPASASTSAPAAFACAAAPGDPAARRIPLLNIAVDDVALVDLLERFDRGVLVTPNVDHLMLLQRDARLLAAYRRAEYVTVDSQIVFWALRWLGRPVREKISGSDFLPAYCAHHAARAWQGHRARRLFVLGGRPGVAAAAMRAINQRAGFGLVVAAHSPSMRFADDAAECAQVIELIRASGADVLVVGLGAPKQELWIDRHRAALPGVSTFLAVGAAIDFEAGVQPRAPRWVSRAGLEWAWRLGREPGRLWRRYLLRDPMFFWLLLRERLGRYRDPLADHAAS